MSTECQAMFQDLGDSIDRLCTFDLRPPGPTSGYIGRFYQAVRLLTDAPLTLTAAQCLHQIVPQSTIVIATGFCHPERLPYGERDGPPGAAAHSKRQRRQAYRPSLSPRGSSSAACHSPASTLISTAEIAASPHHAVPRASCDPGGTTSPEAGLSTIEFTRIVRTGGAAGEPSGSSA